ncbi:MAG: hypothetical protein COB29_09335 [Sulfitobacter sp.]|nr:MAG: hypothetical protein COB29_09335 [Sulfitobacter sp.]|tara:strand:+ start:2319 stop:2990 length:672 start_codon:yes stop_codon:yes gene_type:complete
MISDSPLINRTEIVKIHLELLEEATNEIASAKQAIKASISLRFLFDGNLNHVAHQMDLDLKIMAPDLREVPTSNALLFACGGYQIGKQDINPYYLYREPGPNSPHRAQFEKEKAASPLHHLLTEHKLSIFMKQPCVAFAGQQFDREAIVRFVANKCGGAHHHDNAKKFGEIEHRMASIGHTLKLPCGDVSAIFLETLGTAWFLLNSPSICKLRATQLNKDSAP